MKNRKYILCSGLAFADQEDMTMLHEYALQGWVFRELKFGIVYVLHKEEPQDLVFSYDMSKVKDEDKEDYRMLFEEAGWTLIPPWSRDTHFFYAKNGTTAVHSEEETRNEQYQPIFVTAAITCIIGILLIPLTFWLKWVYLAPISGACLGGGGLLLIGCYLRTKGKRLRLNPRTYYYQLIKFLIGLGLLYMLLQLKTDFDLYTCIVGAVVLWLLAGSVYGCYRTYQHKHRK